LRAAREGPNEPSQERLGALRRKKFAGMTRREAGGCILTRRQETKMEIPVYYLTENGKHARMALQPRTPSSKLRRFPPWRSSEGGYCATRNDLRVCVAHGRKASLTIHLTSEKRQTLLTGASGRERVSKLDPS
jgi:hypothetical protein